MGTRRMVLPMECSPRIFQKVWLLRQHLDGGAPEWDAQAANPQSAPRRAHPAGGEFRNVGFEAAVEKIENVVLGRADPGGKGGPRYRRERRERGAQAVKRPLFLQAAQIRQFALGHEALGEPRIETVEAQKNETPDFGPPETAPAADHRACGAKRPEQKRDGGEKERRDQAEERPQKGKPGARPDVTEKGRHYITMFAESVAGATRQTDENVISAFAKPW